MDLEVLEKIKLEMVKNIGKECESRSTTQRVEFNRVIPILDGQKEIIDYVTKALTQVVGKAAEAEEDAEEKCKFLCGEMLKLVRDLSTHKQKMDDNQLYVSALSNAWKNIAPDVKNMVERQFDRIEMLHSLAQDQGKSEKLSRKIRRPGERPERVKNLRDAKKLFGDDESDEEIEEPILLGGEDE